MTRVHSDLSDLFEKWSTQTKDLKERVPVKTNLWDLTSSPFKVGAPTKGRIRKHQNIPCEMLASILIANSATIWFSSANRCVQSSISLSLVFAIWSRKSLR